MAHGMHRAIDVERGRSTVSTMATPPLTEHQTRRFTSDEVWAMVEHGILDEDEPFELLDGELVYVSPHEPSHAMAVVRLNRLLVLAYDLVGEVRPQVPVGGIRDSIPEPDWRWHVERPPTTSRTRTVRTSSSSSR